MKPLDSIIPINKGIRIYQDILSEELPSRTVPGLYMRGLTRSVERRKQKKPSYFKVHLGRGNSDHTWDELKITVQKNFPLFEYFNDQVNSPYLFRAIINVKFVHFNPENRNSLLRLDGGALLAVDKWFLDEIEKCPFFWDTPSPGKKLNLFQFVRGDIPREINTSSEATG